MHRSELSDLEPCVDCGGTVDLRAGEGFTFGSRGVLCHECAMRRGGSYDADRDAWTEAPRLDDFVGRYGYED